MKQRFDAMDIAKLKLLQTLEECNKHIKRMLYAYRKMTKFMPLDAIKYDHLTEEQVESVDQFIFRFSKLQDAMGERLFRGVLIFLAEEVKNKPFLDLLNRLEQLEIIESKDEWLFLRTLRNALSHEYFNESEANALNINMVYENTEKLYDIFVRIKRHIHDNLFTLNTIDDFVLETMPFPRNAPNPTRNTDY
jgi:hypothetical protein